MAPMVAMRRRKTPPPEPLSPKEEAAFLRRARSNPRLHAAALLMLDGGLQAAEVVRLKVVDLDLDSDPPGVWVRRPEGYAWRADISVETASALARLAPPGADPERPVFGGWRNRQAVCAALKQAGAPAGRLRMTFLARLAAGRAPNGGGDALWAPGERSMGGLGA